MRLFVAVRPPTGAVVGANPHVTLRFLGEVPDDQVDAVTDALRAGLAGVPPCEATVGTGVRRLGATAVVLPVTGLDELGTRVRDATSAFAGDDRRFRGHLTVARARRDRPLPALSLPDGPVRWVVDEVELVRSELGQGEGRTARHTVVATVRLGSLG